MKPTGVPPRTRFSRSAEREARGTAAHFPGRGARRRQDLRDAAGRPGPQGRRRRRRDRRRRDARPQGDRGAGRRASRSFRASRSPTRTARSRRWISTPSWRAGRSWCWSTSSPTPTPPAAAIPSAISMSRNSLAPGIDVYTTVNIQHVESLNDVVAQITRIRVRETVPDSIIDRADDIEVIDLTPGDLIERLKQGKVYLPTTAKSAHRELFLAGQPDGAAGTGPAAHGAAGRRAACSATCRSTRSPGRGPAGDRVLVCIDEAAALAGAGPLRQAAGRTAARALVGAHRRDARDRRGFREAERDRLALALRLGRDARTPKRRPCQAATSPRKSSAMRASTMSPISSSDARTSRAGANGSKVRPRTT